MFCRILYSHVSNTVWAKHQGLVLKNFQMQFGGQHRSGMPRPSQSTPKVKVGEYKKVQLYRSHVPVGLGSRDKLQLLADSVCQHEDVCHSFICHLGRQIASGHATPGFYSHFSKEPLQDTTLSAVENFQKHCELLPYHFSRSAWQEFISKAYIKRLRLLAQLQSQCHCH